MPNPTSERELRDWLARKLRVPVERPVWQMLKAERYVDTALDPRETGGREELLGAARRWRRFHRGARSIKPPRPGKPLPLAKLVSKGEWRRAEVFSKQLGRLAAEDERVRRVRSQLFPKGLLTRSEAASLLASHAPRFCSPGFFTEHGIPLAAHRSRFIDDYHPRNVMPLCFSDTMKVLIEWKGGELEVPYTFKMEQALHAKGCDKLAILGDSGTILYGSVFDQLREASMDIVRHYHWTEAQAAWFILTGRPAAFPPVSVRYEGGWHHDHRHGRLHMMVEPWASARSVLNVYRDAQRRVFGRRGRPLGDQNLGLADFVAERMSETPSAQTWRALMAAWNASRRGRGYDDVRRFARDFQRTYGLLMFPQVSLFLHASDDPQPARPRAATVRHARREKTAKRSHA